MHPFIKKVLYTEIPKDFKHPLIIPLGLIWGVLTYVVLYGLLFLFGSVEEFNSVLAVVNSTENNLWFYFFVFATAFGLLFRLYFVITGITQYQNRMGKELEQSYVVFCISSVIVQNITMWVVFLICGIYLNIKGGVFLDGFDLNFLLKSYQEIINKIPTIVTLPKYFAITASYIVISFFGYWWHRISHESRILWLLAHRTHHISTTLTSATLFEADPAFVIGSLWQRFMGVLVTGIILKLFTQQFFFIELAIIQFVPGMFEVFNHTSAYYDLGRKNKLFWRLNTFFASGPYHYVHHSSAPEHAVANIGGGFFAFWDRIFGTFVMPPLEIPKIGLTNQPELYQNPFNVTFSGLFQILYELKHNKDFVTRFKIIFGGIYFIPAKTKSFLLKDEKAYYDADEKVKELNTHLYPSK